MDNGGILLVHPEHILSFKLMGLESCISGKETVGRKLLQTQNFFDESSRDLVDESDENFSVKFELIYTMGAQRPAELAPQRWIYIQQVLNLVSSVSAKVFGDLPLSLERGYGSEGGFPRVRILKPDAEERLVHGLAREICNKGLPGFSISRQAERVRNDVFTYMTKLKLTDEEIDNVERPGPGGFWNETTKGTLLLLRGLLAGGFLGFAFAQKRWRVNYGLLSSRILSTKLAVPYRAKDSPTPRSEFSHPDVVTVLTSLSYYYGGISDEDIFAALHHLMLSDQADAEYTSWVKNSPNLPNEFRLLQGVNLKDRVQCEKEIFPHLMLSKSVIDYFLSHMVFPKEMKEFPHKLSASGWDIGKPKQQPTTGFSGTCDSSKLLPLDVMHIDLPEQSHTNALVLEYLLQPRNSVFVMPQQSDATHSDAEHLLQTVMKFD